MIMLKKIYYLFIFSFSIAITDYDLSSRMIIDGISTDFSDDERILYDSEYNLLESPEDSFWGEYNDIKQIKVTWDINYLYIAVDACSYDNNVMLFIDVADDYGIEDMSQTSAWRRSFKFFNMNPDYFIGTWDTNSTPQVWQVQSGGSIQINQINPDQVEVYATYNTGNLQGAMEVKMPWSLISLDAQPIEKIKLLGVITGSDEYSGSPDCAPDNLGGMSNDSFQSAILDNYAEITIDEDGDGTPDIGVSPQSRVEFLKTPPFEPVPIEVYMVDFPNGQTFCPSIDGSIIFELTTNRFMEFNVKIFDLNGKYIADASPAKEDRVWSWNGKDSSGRDVQFGIYLLHFISDSREVSYKEAVVLVR